MNQRRLQSLYPVDCCGSFLCQVRLYLQKKNNVGAVENFKTASPLLKPDAGSYARNQYRLAFALLNLKKITDAKAALTDAASVNSPYKQPALDKLKALNAAVAAKAKS